MTNLQTRLNQLMSQKHYNAIDIEKITGVNRNTIYSILSGYSKKPGAQTLQLIAKALDVSLDSLLIDKQLPKAEILTIDQVKIFSDATQIVANIVVEKKLKLSIENFNFLINEVYQYSIQITPPYIDDRFVHWVINKYCKT